MKLASTSAAPSSWGRFCIFWLSAPSAGLMRTLRLCRSNPSGSLTFARHSPYLSRMSTCIFVTTSGSRSGKLSSNGRASFERFSNLNLKIVKVEVQSTRTNDASTV
uniref:Uncharacterized protein n=1 Tax=Glossina austeni TaxID=7395 RepID=A0A1A9VBB2_GLOAU